MFGQRNIGIANIALAVGVCIGVSGGVGLFAAGAFIPVVICVGLPFGTEAVSVGGISGLLCGGRGSGILAATSA